MTFKLNITPRIEQIIDNMHGVYKKANLYQFREPDKYRQILSDFYTEEKRRRIENIHRIKEGTKEQQVKNIKTLKQRLCQNENIIETMVDWDTTYNPQNINEGLPSSIPMIPWWKQVELIEWIFQHIFDVERRGGLVEKSRETAVSWTFVVIWIQIWRWMEGAALGMGSNIVDNVDKKDDPKCFFEKIRRYLKGKPFWWMPEGWNWNVHDKYCNLVNPEMNSNISGDGGKNIGTGGRCLAYLCDEKAKFDFPNMADNSLSYNTKAQFDVGTYVGPNEFYTKRMSGRVDVFIMDWHDDPRKSQEWYGREVATRDPELIAQELDRNPLASVGGIQIKPEWVKAAFDINLKPSGPICTALDAGGDSGECGFAVRMGPVIRSETWKGIPDGIEQAHRSLEHSTKANAQWFSYDMVGVGFAVTSALKSTERKITIPIFGLNAGDPASDMEYEEFEKRKGHEIFFDARSEWWYLFANALERTYEHVKGIKKHPESELIDLERNGELQAQLCSPLKKTTTKGKKKTESKDEMKRRGIKSPHEADAIVMAYMPKDAGRKHVIENEIHQEPAIVDWEKIPIQQCRHYGAVCQRKDLSLNIMCVIWEEVYGRLWIYDELIYETVEPNRVAKDLVNTMHLKEKELDRLIGNPMMFADQKRTVVKEINIPLGFLTQNYATVKIKEPRKYDPYGSIVILNYLNNNTKLIIDPKCVEVKRQLATWRLDHGEAKEEGMREGLLMIASELQRIIPKEEILKYKEYTKLLRDQIKGTEFMKV